ncbi:hypothetical protein [Halalkalibacter alkalisediminis]|nr:hypothetical protein [Halalkalibacter alkalisediminis]
MAEIMDNLLGFLPPGGVFIGGAGVAILILAFQFLNKWLHHILKLPWMQEENQRKRKQLEQNANNQQKSN